MRNINDVLRDVVHREDQSLLYDIRINGIPIYSLIRVDVRKKVEHAAGLNIMQLRNPVQTSKVIHSIIISIIDIVRMLLCGKKARIVLFPFPRLDKVNDTYMDKFTDPLIQFFNQHDTYISLQYGKGGHFMEPRLNRNHIIDCDAITLFKKLWAKLFSFFYEKKYQQEFQILFSKLDNVFPEISYNRYFYTLEIIESLVEITILKRILAKLGACYAFTVARPTTIIAACKCIGIKTMELQHGITYQESDLYSGFHEETVSPDYFLSFGDNKPNNVYGISEDRILNIGWAFHDYLNNICPNERTFNKSVLVISDPEITNNLLMVIKTAAKNFRDWKFYYRCHPHEFLTSKQLQLISEEPNLLVQDKSINISILLQQYQYVMGENSTVLYEAIANGNCVAKLFFDGLNPTYLCPEDSKFFYEVHDMFSLGKFLLHTEKKMSRSIYSKFNFELFSNILK